MSQQTRRTLAAVGLAAALLLAVPAPSRAAGFQGPSFAAAGLLERVWSWLWSLAPSRSGQISTPMTRTGTSTGVTLPPVAPPPPTGTDESGSHIDPDGKP